MAGKRRTPLRILNKSSPKRRIADGSFSEVSKSTKGRSSYTSIAIEDEDIDYDDHSTFCELVKKSGLTLKSGKQENILRVDQAKFQKEFLRNLQIHPQYPEVIDDVLKSFQKYLEDRSRLKYSLKETVSSPECSSAGVSRQDSVIHLLLGIDKLQMPICNFLIEKIVEMTLEEGEQETNHSSLILNQFRWLDCLVNSKDLAEKLLELIPAVPLNIQRDIILSLPDIVDDSEHLDIAKKLGSLMLENKELNATILDALSNLNIKPDVVSQVRTTVLKTLQTVDLKLLPVVVKFVLSSLDSPDIQQVISELRANLDFKTILSPSLSSTPKNRSVEDNYEVLTMDEIKSAVRFQKAIGEAWMKAIEAVKTSHEHKPFDFLFLVMFYSLSMEKARVESMIRNKIRSGHFTTALLDTTFNCHSQVLKSFVSPLLRLNETLLRCSDLAVSKFGSHLYHQTFLSFDNAYKQDVVANLVTHVGSGGTMEMDAALNCLCELVKKHTKQMAPFGTFIKSILDYISNLTLCQTRTLFTMISLLAYQGGSQGALLQDELHIIIRKQLSNYNPKFRRMGVIGALMTVKAMAGPKEDCTLNQSASTSKINDSTRSEDIQPAIQLLELVREATASYPNAIALFYDELCKIILHEELSSKIEAWINDTIISDFQDDYIVDVDQHTETLSEPVKQELRYGLDNILDGSIALNLTPIYLSEKNKTVTTKRHTSLLTLTPLFRLLRICEQTLHGDSLEAIDALLGCPIFMPSSEVCTSFSSLSLDLKQFVCSVTFHCINWLREVVNGFAGTQDADLKCKVVERVKNIVELQKCLERWLPAVPGFHPPLVNFDLDVTDIKLPSPVSHQPGKKPGSLKGKKRKRTKGSEEEGPAETQLTVPPTARTQTDKQDDEKEMEVDSDVNTVSLDAYKAFFRELDLDVFVILHNGVGYGKEKEKTQFCSSELYFLLDELNKRLEHILVTSTFNRFLALKGRGSREIGFSNLNLYSSVDVVRFVIPLLPSFCQLLEDCSAYFQNIIAENDGVVDSTLMFTPEAKEMGQCMELLLSNFNALFSWNGFVGPTYRTELRNSFQTLSSRVGTTQFTQVHVMELGKRAFSYICKFSESVPNIACAIALLQLLKSISGRIELETATQDISKISEAFLKRSWQTDSGQTSTGKQFNHAVEHVLNIYLSSSSQDLEKLDNVVSKCLLDVLNSDGNISTSDVYPTLNKSSFNTYYKMLHLHLVESVKEFSLNIPKEKEGRLDHLHKWAQSIHIFHCLVNVLKKVDNNQVLCACLKYSKQFVELFLHQSIPLLNYLFKSHHDDVQTVLKNLQFSTRYLQHVCCHTKVTKDVVLTNHVPPLKKTLEVLVCSVKNLLVSNNCNKAFWVGNLKNRDLKGQEILSQSTAAESSICMSTPQEGEQDVEMEEENNASESEIQKDDQSGEEEDSDHSEEF